MVTSIFILLSEDRSVLWLLRTKIREPFGLSQIFCLLVKRTGLAYQRIILHIGNWWTIGKKLPQDAIKVTMNHNSRSVEHKTLLTAFGIISIIISGILQKIIFGNQSMIFAMSCISLLGSVVWGHHMYTVGLETDTRAYFTGVTIFISLPTGTKIFNWLSTYLGNPPLLHLKTSSAFFGLLFLLMFTIGGSTGIILGNAAVDLGLHDTYYVVAHFHFVLSLGAVIAIFSGIIFNGEKIVGTNNLLLSSSSTLSLYHLHLIFIGILLTFSPMHFLGFNVMPRRIPSFPDTFHSWNLLSSVGSGITFLSFGIFSY